MPQLTVEGFGTFDVAQGKRLVLALEEDAGVDQLHACGGNCRCTTCRVEFVAGEPESMTQPEKDKLAGARFERGASLLPDSDERRDARPGHQPPGGQWAGRCRRKAGGGDSPGAGVGGEGIRSNR